MNKRVSPTGPFDPPPESFQYVFSGAIAAAALVFVAGCARDNGSATTDAASEPGVVLADGTPGSGLNGFENLTGARGEFWFPETMGGGTAVLDFDRDGDLDILAATGGVWEGDGNPPMAVYRNEGNLRFVDVTAAVGVPTMDAYTMGFAIGDVDGDGWEDVFVTALHANLLFMNNRGTFVEASRAAGVSGESSWSTSAAFLDAENDGDLDLLVGNYVRWTPETDLWCSNDGTDKTYCTPALYEGLPPSFYVNNGDGTFTDQTHSSGFASGGGKTLGVVSFDYNGDGAVDVAIANDTRADELFLNDGSGVFKDVGLTAGFAYDERGKARAGMGVDATEDPAGAWSLAVGNFADEMIGVYNDVGNGTLVDRSSALKVGLPSLRTLTFGLLFTDVNLDGNDDLIAVNGHIQQEIGRIRDNVEYEQPPHVFIREGDVFRDVAGAQGVSEPIVGRGLASGDLDGDGDTDYVVSINGGGLRLWENRSIDAGARVLRLDIARGRAPSSTIGSRIHVYRNGSRKSYSVRGGRSYLSAPAYEILIGLAAPGGADMLRVDSVVVTWPGGARAVVDGVDVMVDSMNVVDTGL